MTYSAALPHRVHVDAGQHLLRADGQEDLCFALWNPSAGRDRYTACVRELLLPQPGERRVHGNVSFTPEYFERAVLTARRAGCGLALMHSHPAPGWQGMSDDDVRADEGNAPAVAAATKLPFLGLTLGTDGAWSARFWERVGPRKYARCWCGCVRVVGQRLNLTFDVNQRPVPSFRARLARTISAWGRRSQADLMRLRVGIVGAGSVGALVAESLARMGVGHIVLIDFDRVEDVNLDRLLHATDEDAERELPKVRMLAQALKSSATAEGFIVTPLEASVVEPDAFKAALDCDVLFSCVDRPWGRSALNLIAYAHLIPVIDGGLALTPMRNDGGLRRGTWRAHVAGPTRRCLECLGQYDPGLVAVERDGWLDDPNYIEKLPDEHPLRQNQNVFAFSMSVAALEVEQFLRMIVLHPGRPDIGAQTVHFVPATMDRDVSGCGPHCPYCDMVAMGDRSGIEITGRYPRAEVARLRAPRKKSFFLRMTASLRRAINDFRNV